MRLSTIITTLISLTSTLAAAAPVVDEPALALRRPPDEPGYEQCYASYNKHKRSTWTHEEVGELLKRC